MSESRDMSCQELVELVTEYIEGTQSAEDRARFEAHLATCSGCRAYIDQMRRTVRIVGKLDEESISDEARNQLFRAFQTWKQTP